jgi:hypothetical protein
MSIQAAGLDAGGETCGAELLEEVKRMELAKPISVLCATPNSLMASALGPGVDDGGHRHQVMLRAMSNEHVVEPSRDVQLEERQQTLMGDSKRSQLSPVPASARLQVRPLSLLTHPDHTPRVLPSKKKQPYHT